MKNNTSVTTATAITEKELIDYLDTFTASTALSEKEKRQFINIAKAYGLNPFKREIYAVAYGEGSKRKCSIVTGYEVYIKRAERTGKLNGWRAWVEGSGSSLIGVVEIKRKDWDSAFMHEVYIEEVCQQNSFWAKQPKFMLKKVAIGQAFRLCFPDEIGGMPYTADEIGYENNFVETPTGADLAAQAFPANPERIERKRILAEIGSVLKHEVFSDTDRSAYRERIVKFGEDNHVVLIKELLEEVQAELAARTAAAGESAEEYRE